MQIKISIALTDLLIKLQNIMITRFHLNTVGGKGWGAYNQMYLKNFFQVEYGPIIAKVLF